ncbi:MAG: hypothetical protein ACRC2O_03895 [Chitinophagaceae bacterium]
MYLYALPFSKAIKNIPSLNEAWIHFIQWNTLPTLVEFQKEIKMYEHKKQPLASSRTYYQRVLKNLFLASVILLFCMCAGILGYHFLAGAPWIDAFHNAAMILSGMGPVIQIENTAGKLFSSVYALFSGVIFIATIGFILAPAIHRLFHRLHIEEK